MRIGWKGVFPAVTTQIREDLSIDLADTQRVVDDHRAQAVHAPADTR